jgi:hypothetical protein
MTPEDLSPAEAVEVGMVGDPAQSNKLAIASASSLSISGSYSGTAYTLAGPADTGASPVQLGFKQGDKLRLRGSVGTELNHGRELTLVNPAAITVFETLAFPDSDEYEYTVLRRLL